jgi:hypothetical protein
MTTTTLAIRETLDDSRVTAKTARLNDVASNPTKIWTGKALHRLVFDTMMAIGTATGAHVLEHAAVLHIGPHAKPNLEAIIIRNHSETTTAAVGAVCLTGQG